MRHRAAVILGAAIAAQLALPAFALPANAVAFRDAALGAPIKNRSMPTVDGRKEQLLAPGKTTVFVFFRVGQDHSVEALRQFAELERELAGKPVRWIGIVSSTDPRDAVLAVVRETGIRMPVVVDEGDAFYGELGVSLHPSVGIADERQRLAGYQPFRKINLRDAVRGRIQLVLGEIDDAQLARVLDPPPAPVATKSRAHARVTLAKALLAAGKIDDAVASLRAAVVLDANYVPAHTVLAEALARKGVCAEAEREREEARRLAPADSTAAAPIACAGR